MNKFVTFSCGIFFRTQCTKYYQNRFVLSYSRNNRAVFLDHVVYCRQSDVRGFSVTVNNNGQFSLHEFLQQQIIEAEVHIVIGTSLLNILNIYLINNFSVSCTIGRTTKQACVKASKRSMGRTDEEHIGLRALNATSEFICQKYPSTKIVRPFRLRYSCLKPLILLLSEITVFTHTQ